jgi:amino acid transporter
MASSPLNPGSQRPVANVLVATTAMLSFISFWRAGAIVLNDLASSAYYAGGEAEQFIGKSAPWFILGVMLLAYAVSLIYVESCSMFVRGGVYRVVKEAMGGTLAKFSVSALMFDYILTGPISGVAAGQYIAGLSNELLHYAHIRLSLHVNATAAVIAILVTAYFWWQNIKGIPESSEKALRIMELTTVMVVVLIVWCVYTIWVRGVHWPPAPVPRNVILDRHSLGWLASFHWAHTLTLVIIFVGLGHSVLAMSGEETLAQVYREIEHPKLPNLKKTALIIFIYSLLFTALVSFFAVMIIPDRIRPHFFENLIGGLAMSLQGPFGFRLAFHVFVVIVGMLILSGAVNTAIVGSNGVLSRVSEDGVLTDWFRHPHRRFGTSYRIITAVAGLQVVTILISRGDVDFLGNLYAFGVIWSFALKGIAVLVLRYTHPQDREYRVPLNFTIAGKEIPLGLALITMVLLLIAVVNLFTKPDATIAGVVFSVLLFIGFTLSERSVHRRVGSTQAAELDQFNLAQEADLSPANVGARPGNVLVPVSNYYALYHLHSALERLKANEQDVVVLHIRLLRRAGSGEYDLRPDQLFSTIEQLLFTKVLAIAEKEGKPVRLAVAAANDLWDGILRAAANLQSSSIVVGSSSKMPINEQAREVGIAWERMPEPRPRLALDIFTPGGQERIFYLGPHAPHLTPKEIDLLHNIWLQLSDELPGEDLHHHDIIHFALTELTREMSEGRSNGMLERLREHLREIKDRRAPTP